MKNLVLTILIAGLTATAAFAGSRSICINGYQLSDAELAIVEQYEQATGARLADGCYQMDPITGQLMLISASGHKTKRGFWSRVKDNIRAYNQQMEYQRQLQYQQQMQQGYEGLWTPYRSQYSNGSTVSSPRTDTTAYYDSDGSPIGVNVGGSIITLP